VCEVLGEQRPSTAICFGMHCVASAVIAAKATADQAARSLEPICAGAHLTTLALSEPGTGAHLYIPQAELHPADGGDFILSGTKTFVTSGGYAAFYVMSVAAAGAPAASGEFSMVAVSTNSSPRSTACSRSERRETHPLATATAKRIPRDRPSGCAAQPRLISGLPRQAAFAYTTCALSGHPWGAVGRGTNDRWSGGG
jgi:alkylation response protein AidB-like acyl-CoA dehydrogenase